jgi:TetR/AcrR family transcriptional regulator, mexJK operon transcriptional repressor
MSGMVESKEIARSRTKARGRGGRPRSADLDKLNEKIIATAVDLFLQRGFDGTSMDAIAEKARVSKRTLYARHADKAALFNTAMFDLLGRTLIPVETIQYEPNDLDSVLHAIARDMVTGVIRPDFLAVYRLVVFEAQRRPEFGRWINEARRRPAVQTIAAILQRHRDELRKPDFELAAEQFMSLTVDLALRLGTFGIEPTPEEIEKRLGAAVDLFLNGARRRNDRKKAPSDRRKATAAKK